MAMNLADFLGRVNRDKEEQGQTQQSSLPLSTFTTQRQGGGSLLDMVASDLPEFQPFNQLQESFNALEEQLMQRRQEIEQNVQAMREQLAQNTREQLGLPDTGQQQQPRPGNTPQQPNLPSQASPTAQNTLNTKFPTGGGRTPNPLGSGIGNIGDMLQPGDPDALNYWANNPLPENLPQRHTVYDPEILKALEGKRGQPASPNSLAQKPSSTPKSTAQSTSQSSSVADRVNTQIPGVNLAIGRYL